MQTLPPTQHETTGTPATTPRNWLVLVALLVLSQALNVWIISQTITGGFAGWTRMFQRAPFDAPAAGTPALPQHVSVVLLTSPPAPTPDPAR